MRLVPFPEHEKTFTKRIRKWLKDLGYRKIKKRNMLDNVGVFSAGLRREQAIDILEFKLQDTSPEQFRAYLFQWAFRNGLALEIVKLYGEEAGHANGNLFWVRTLGGWVYIAFCEEFENEDDSDWHEMQIVVASNFAAFQRWLSGDMIRGGAEIRRQLWSHITN